LGFVWGGFWVGLGLGYCCPAHSSKKKLVSRFLVPAIRSGKKEAGIRIFIFYRHTQPDGIGKLPAIKKGGDNRIWSRIRPKKEDEQIAFEQRRAGQETLLGL